MVKILQTKSRQFEQRYINEQTGEITTQHTNRVVYTDKDKGYLMFLNKNKIVSFEGLTLPPDITNIQAGMMYRLATRTEKATNLISYRSHNSTKPAGIKDISNYLGVSERRARLFINAMLRKRIIGKIVVKVGSDTTVQYYVNPIYFMHGKWLNANLYFLFQNDLDGVLPQYAKDFFQDIDDKANSTKKKSIKQA